MKSFFSHIRFNWKSGLTVSLVAIPLSISLAVAAGATPTQGIITAMWAGVIAGLFGGSNFNIMGPTGALSGVLATFVFMNGIGSLPILSIIVGVVILLAWALHFERYLIYIPANTIQGFTIGVAFTIAFNQFNFAFGLSGLPKHETFLANLLESFKHISSASWQASLVFFSFFCLLFIVDFLWKKMKSVPYIPAAALLAPFGILLGYLSQTHQIPLTVQTLGMRFTDLSPRFFLPFSFRVDWNLSFLSTVLTIALIAIIETMLSAKIADGMTKTKHNKRKEMFGLGLANIVSGFAGGIPATAALARTSLNIKSGATHKTSAVMSAMFVAIISLFLLPYFSYIPLPVVAAILVVVAVRMVEREHLKRMFKIDRKSFYIAMIVAVVTVWIDPMIGILVGASVSLVIFLDTLSHGQFELTANDKNKKIVGTVSGDTMKKLSKKTHTLIYSIKGHLTYVDSQAHIARFESDLTGYEHVILRLRELYFVDLDGLDAFDEIVNLIQAKGKQVYISGTNPLIISMMRESHVFKKLQKCDVVYAHTSDALRELGFHSGVKHEYC
ncbi:MAG: SulP family inorganic anion transporter [Candidatus Uhrbacteria bacterium]|nr:SulP family inorganic anion transporter [Candidatus Uhrbacteria bacterium]